MAERPAGLVGVDRTPSGTSGARTPCPAGARMTTMNGGMTTTTTTIETPTTGVVVPKAFAAPVIAPAPGVSLADSRAFCEQLTRAKARNFYYGLKLLPEPKRSDMFALYAYMRLVDDIADEEDGRDHDQRVADLEAWRLQTHAALNGELPPDATHELWPAFSEMVRRCNIPASCFDAVIAGQSQDLRPLRIDTFEQLHEYCYRVAGVVGLASVCVWGYDGGAETEKLAVA